MIEEHDIEGYVMADDGFFGIDEELNDFTETDVVFNPCLRSY